MNRKLLALLAGNAKRGEFRAEGNTIYVYDAIVASDADAEWFGGVSAESFVKTLKGMSGDVELRINSPGGDVFGAKAMSQAMREHGGKITAHVDGYAASAASHLVTNADTAIMAPGAMLMIHNAWTIAIGNAADFSHLAGVLDKVDAGIAADYAASASRRGKDVQDFAALMSAETWFTPDEAIAAGLADEQAAEKVKAKVEWDLSAYEHAPPPHEAAAEASAAARAAEEAAAALAAAAAATAAAAKTEADAAAEQTIEIEDRRRRLSAAIDLRTAA